MHAAPPGWLVLPLVTWSPRQLYQSPQRGGNRPDMQGSNEAHRPGTSHMGTRWDKDVREGWDKG